MRIKIDNRENLERDTHSMGIVNTDSSARDRYFKAKRKMVSDKNEIEDLKERLTKLESIVSRLDAGTMRF